MKLEMIDVLPTAWSPMKTSLYLRSALVEEAAAPADDGGATRLMCTHAFDVQTPLQLLDGNKHRNFYLSTAKEKNSLVSFFP